MTLLVASIFTDDLAAVQRGAERAWAGGADAVELRIDTLKDDPAKLAAYLSKHSDHTWIVTCRSAQEGGGCTADTAKRVSLIISAARGTDAYVDFEFTDWRRSSNIRQKVLMAARGAGGSGHRLILSAHDFAGQPADVKAIVAEIARANPTAVAKVAYRGADICDSFAALDLLHDHGSCVTAICMGEHGLWSRVLVKKLGGFSGYCALNPDAATAPGQIALSEMVDLYRWNTLDSSTQVFGVLGDPAAHSMSPLLFNHWFAKQGINAVYLPLRVRGDGDCLFRFLDGCMDRRWLDVGGFSVTVPHKESALRWLGDAARVGQDPQSGRAKMIFSSTHCTTLPPTGTSIGAINTLVFRDNKRAGYNTDCPAVVASVGNALGCSQGDLARLPVDVLGTGGAARAVLAGLRAVGCALTVYGRSSAKTGELAAALDCRPASWGDRKNRTGEVLINATSVGMWPRIDESPMPADSFSGCRLVFDLIYNPLWTKLLQDAEQSGALMVLSGLDMFVRQAAMQFELWTGKSPDTGLAKELITGELHRRTAIGTQT